MKPQPIKAVPPLDDALPARKPMARAARVTLFERPLGTSLDPRRPPSGYRQASLPQEGDAFAVQEAGIGTSWEHHERAVVDVCFRH